MTMRAMIFNGPGKPLTLRRVDMPKAGPGQVLIRVLACAVCRTDLHVLDGDLREPRLPLIPGHEIIGLVEKAGSGVTTLAPGERVGVPWLGWTCGDCSYCRTGQENLCEKAKFTGYTLDGGFAEYCVAEARYCFRIPDRYDDVHAAPLMCAGLIGFRAYARLPDGARRIGLYGFGAAAHILAQVARREGKELYAFTRPGDEESQAFARALGAVWAGGSDAASPRLLDAAILFAPVGALVPVALRAVRPGGQVVCAGIHMSDIPAFPYADLWREKHISSVANLTRADGEGFMKVAAQIPIETSVALYPLHDANRALDDLRRGRFDGAAVLVP